jgi:hypothetical protein
VDSAFDKTLSPKPDDFVDVATLSPPSFGLIFSGSTLGLSFMESTFGLSFIESIFTAGAAVAPRNGLSVSFIPPFIESTFGLSFMLSTFGLSFIALELDLARRFWARDFFIVSAASVTFSHFTTQDPKPCEKKTKKTRTSSNQPNCKTSARRLITA